MRKPLYSITVILSFVAFVFWCNKPEQQFSEISEIPSIIFYTSLADSLPKKTFEALQVGKVIGAKISGKGLDVRYFQYEADADVLIGALSESSFDINTIVIADTTCRSVDYSYLKMSLSNVSEGEFPYAASFLNAGEGLEVYECVKSPLKHQVVVDRASRKVWHRIERFG